MLSVIFWTLYVFFAITFFLYVYLKSRKQRNREHFGGILFISLIMWWVFLIKELLTRNSVLNDDLKHIEKIFN